MLFFKEKKVCNCMCHKEGCSMMHCMPCCEFTYQTYIKTNGQLDEEKYKELLNTIKDKK